MLWAQLLLLPDGASVRQGACQGSSDPSPGFSTSRLRCMLSFKGAAALQVWLALEEKGIPYDTMFINLRKKPEWFKDVVPTNKVPAVSINGQMIWESDAILEVSVATPLLRCALDSPLELALRVTSAVHGSHLRAERDHCAAVPGRRTMTPAALWTCQHRACAPRG